MKEIEINGVKYAPVTDAELCENYSIVRTYSAGVFAGEIVSRDGKECTMKNARRLWFWAGAASLSEMATKGTSDPDACKFPCAVAEVILTEVIEVLACTRIAQESIMGVKEWTQH